MRILVSNPDTIGDMVLRQPFYAALRAAGHELMLIVRSSVRPLATRIAPEAPVLELPYEVYADDLPRHWEAFGPLFDDARAFAPDALVIAPFRWTLFEERLAEELSGVPRYGMTGRLYDGNPHAGHAPESRMRLDVAAPVSEDQPEVAKYAALASAVLGRSMTLPDPVLHPDEPSLREASDTLQRLGLDPGGFLIAGVAGTANVPLKRWRAEAWGELLAHWSNTFGRRFLFVGLPGEAALIGAVRQAMGEGARLSPAWDQGGSLDQLLALTSLSRGYAGHDTGPMHLAAAAGKPVLAVFGGGTWPRFVPAVSPSCAITVGVPCAGCGWACTFEKPHCIDDVPADAVKRAIDDMEAGRISGREMRVIPAGPDLQFRMVREAGELVRVQVRHTADLARQVQDLRQAHDAHVASLRGEFATHLADVQARADARIDSEVRSRAETDERVALELTQLRERVAALEPKPKPPREPWKVRFGRWIVGKHYYVPPLGFWPLPKITIVTPVLNGERWIRQTVESVLGQGYPKLEYIVVDGGSTDGTLKILDEYRDRIDRIISEPDRGMYDAVGKGFDLATGDVLGYLNADDLYEPGGLLRVGEFFRRHPFARVVYHDNTVIHDGWRFPNFAQPHADVYRLLAGQVLYQDGVFFRKKAYELAGGINRDLTRAGDGELWLRLARMWGLRRGRGHVSAFRVRAGQISEDRAAYDAELAHGRRQFLARFGLPGRMRCRVIQGVNALRNLAERMRGPRRLFWRIDYFGKPHPPAEAPPHVPQHPVSPVTGQAPDRLLFSTRDTRYPDPRLHYLYYESKTGVALTYPPLDATALAALRRKDLAERSSRIIPPDTRFHSPYQNIRGGQIVSRNLYRLPAPIEPVIYRNDEDEHAAHIVRLVEQRFAPSNNNVRLLDASCRHGHLLDELKARSKWRLFGLEADPDLAAEAGRRGHEVWSASPDDAPLTLPIDACFDLIYFGELSRQADPLITLNRLRPLLAPGGMMVLAVPNLDSKLVEFFGPTWVHWHAPHHRTLFGRRGLGELARLAGLRVIGTQTYTDPGWAALSFQLNRLGLGAVVPSNASLSASMTTYGRNLAGWCRLLWDWRGQGDHLFAALVHA